MPRGWQPRHPQWRPGRHEPRRASRRWPPPRHCRQRIMDNNWPSTPPASAPSHVPGSPTPGPQQTTPTTANDAAARSSHEPGAAASSFLRLRLAAAGAVRPCRSPGPSPKHVLLRPLLGFVPLRRMHGSSWLTRWSAIIIAVAAQRAVATTLLEQPAHGASVGGDIPELPEPLADDRWQTPAGPYACHLIRVGGLDHGHLREKGPRGGKKQCDGFACNCVEIKNVLFPSPFPIHSVLKLTTRLPLTIRLFFSHFF